MFIINICQALKLSILRTLLHSIFWNIIIPALHMWKLWLIRLNYLPWASELVNRGRTWIQFVWIQMQCSCPLYQWFPTSVTWWHTLEMIMLVRLNWGKLEGLSGKFFLYEIMAWKIKYKVLQMILNTELAKTFPIKFLQITKFRKFTEGIIPKMFKNHTVVKFWSYKLVISGSSQ